MTGKVSVSNLSNKCTPEKNSSILLFNLPKVLLDSAEAGCKLRIRPFMVPLSF